jgi:hypothetical protein
MPKENTQKHIRSVYRGAKEFQQDTLKTTTLNEKEGIKAVIGKLKGKATIEVVSYLFEKARGLNAEKAKARFKIHHNPPRLTSERSYPSPSRESTRNPNTRRSHDSRFEQKRLATIKEPRLCLKG